MPSLSVTTEIAASAAEVWRVLTDLAHFAQWNPFIREASGELVVGKRIHVRPRTSLGLLSFHPTITRCDRPHELRWRGGLVHPLLARGEHVFAIAPISPGVVRLTQSMTFDGVLPRIAWPLLEPELRGDFEAMHRALAQRVRHASPARRYAS